MKGEVASMPGVQNVAPNSVNDTREEKDIAAFGFAGVINVQGPQGHNPAVEQLLDPNQWYINGQREFGKVLDISQIDHQYSLGFE